MPRKSNTLVVDLDGTLIFTDLLYESFVRAVFKKPWSVFILPLWLIAGLPKLKSKLAVLIDIDLACLPYNHDLIAYLKAERLAGRKIVLCTGSHLRYANQIADHLGIFDDVFATNELTNLTGSKKLHLLIDQYGEHQYSYIGNEKKDIAVWKYAASAGVVGPRSLINQAEDVAFVEWTGDSKQRSLKTLFKSMRVHQWAKNALIFVPLLTSHQIFDVELFMNATLAFVAFGLCASATYLLNDLSDLDSDRNHRSKNTRPLASGALSIKSGLCLSAILMISSLGLALLLPDLFLLVLLGYIGITLAYSFWLKRLQTVDIVVLASLYTFRIFAGSAAVSVTPSFWLLAFSMFVFLCLAIIKRITEIQKKMENSDTTEQISGRGYFPSDLSVLKSLGSSSGLVSILVFAMYLNAPETMGLYTSPMLLWACCPVFGYWIIRALIMTARGQIDEDPVEFAIRDLRSWVVGGVILSILFSARFFEVSL